MCCIFGSIVYIRAIVYKHQNFLKVVVNVIITDQCNKSERNPGNSYFFTGIFYHYIVVYIFSFFFFFFFKFSVCTEIMARMILHMYFLNV